ncbi:DUF4116 domain-containing protein [Flavobacteriales bacterium]|nr:DUF4116 domain-containing protein [Flavobacteriales bacterium]
MDTIQKDDYIEFTLIAGENNQYSNTIKGTAEELNLVGWKISDLDFINEETTLEEFKERCNDEFMGSYGSYDEFAETSTSKKKLTRKDGSVLVCSGYVVQISSEYKEIVLQAVKNNGEALRYASEELRADKEVVLEAVKNKTYRGSALEFASEELKADKDILFELANKDLLNAQQKASWKSPHGNVDALQVFKEGSEESKADREIVLEAVKKHDTCLSYASEELKADKEVVLEAVKAFGASMNHASKELRADKEFVLEAIKHGGDASQYASRELWADKEFVLEAFKYDAGASFRNVSEELKAELKTNEEFLLKAVKVNGLALEYASTKLRADRDVVLEAVKNNGAALQFALLPIDLEFM